MAGNSEERVCAARATRAGELQIFGTKVAAFAAPDVDNREDGPEAVAVWSMERNKYGRREFVVEGVAKFWAHFKGKISIWS